mmetsp:Transcript_14380/g.32256  ORF Transcript_14380/g.32256 Transcript_14380/m.32256 type:complete len:141 (-) Transcript_14380:441-863(-)
MVQWLRAQDPPCEWDFFSCSYAAEKGHLEVLQWMRAQDPPCPWLDMNMCTYAAENVHMEVLRWLLFETDCYYGEKLITALAERGELELIVWLRAEDPPRDWDASASKVAATQSDLETLQFLRGLHPPCPQFRMRGSSDRF